MTSPKKPLTIGEIIALVAVVGPVASFMLAFVILGLAESWQAFSGVIAHAWAIAGGNGADGTQSSMARAAWGGVVVGVVTIPLLGATVIYAAYTSHIARQSLAQTQLMAQRQTRAYVVAHDVTIEFEDPNDFTIPPVIRVMISNTGQTPARQMAMRLSWQNHEPKLPMGIRWEEGYSVWDLGAGQKIVEQIYCPDFIEDTLMDHFFGEAVSWLQGVVLYDDVFGKTHHTWFRMQVSGTVVDATPHIYVQQTQAGNRST